MNSAVKKMLMILLIALVPRAFSAEIEASEYTQQRIGELHKINIAARTAIISGYRYSFSGLKGYDRPKVKMLGSNFGAFEMLRPGMRIRLKYHLSQYSRVVVEAEQVADSTPLGVYNEPE